MDLIIIWLIQAIICACFCGYIAFQKKRGVLAWITLGFLFGIISLIALVAVPSTENTRTNISSKGNSLLFKPQHQSMEMSAIETWECLNCKHINYLSQHKCSHCGTIRQNESS
ncbi:MAG: hypothetical protein Q8S39_03270 [Ignavibacteria bacterium]|nr:hypothetical protein [Ignavibacteria bacterium]